MKKFVLCFIATICLLFVVPTLSNAQIEDGTYSIQYQVNKPNDASASIANDYFLKPAKLIVENGTMKVQLTIKNSNWITEFNGANGGNVVISRNKDADTRLVQFNVPTINSPTLVKMKVDINDLNYHHEYSTDFVWNAGSLQLIEAAKKPVAAEQKPAQNPQVNQTTQNTQVVQQKPATNTQAEEKAKVEAAAKAAEEKAKAEAAKVAEEKAKAEAAAKEAEEKAKAEAAAKEAEEKAKAEAKEAEEKAKAEAEAKEVEEKVKAEKAAQEAEEKEQAAATEKNEKVKSVDEQAIVSEQSKENSISLMWIFIVAGLAIIGIATTVIMKKRTV